MFHKVTHSTLFIRVWGLGRGGGYLTLLSFVKYRPHSFTYHILYLYQWSRFPKIVPLWYKTHTNVFIGRKGQIYIYINIKKGPPFYLTTDYLVKVCMNAALKAYIRMLIICKGRSLGIVWRVDFLHQILWQFGPVRVRCFDLPERRLGPPVRGGRSFQVGRLFDLIWGNSDICLLVSWSVGGSVDYFLKKHR